MHTTARYWLAILVSLALLGGCAALSPEIDPPKISLVYFRSLPSSGGAPKFEITLKVLNPNKEQLDIAGISYTVALLDKELIAGVANDIPPIEAYGEGEVRLEAGLQLLELLRLMASLGASGTEPLAYRFSAKIDFRGFIPTQRIVESGEITLK